MTSPVLPLPNEPFSGGVIVASVWIEDQAPEPVALVLRLRPQPPFYEIAQIIWRDGAWHVQHSETHPNIVPAVEAYTQNGGDY